MRIFLIVGMLLVPILVAFPHGTVAQDLDRIGTLIELLASTNKVLEERHRRSLELPPGYSKKDQVIVFLAIQQLLQEGSEAFDSLAGHFGDERYSMSVDTPSGIRHYSVGTVCWKIMEVNIYCYTDLGVLNNITAGQFRWHEIPLKLPFPDDVKEWWRLNRKKPLWRIQVDMIDREAALFKELDLATSPPVHPHAKRPPIEILESLRSLNIAKLEAMRAGIVATKEPYRPKSIEQPYARLTGLPWQTLSFNH